MGHLPADPQQCRVAVSMEAPLAERGIQGACVFQVEPCVELVRHADAAADLDQLGFVVDRLLPIRLRSSEPEIPGGTGRTRSIARDDVGPRRADRLAARRRTVD